MAYDVNRFIMTPWKCISIIADAKKINGSNQNSINQFDSYFTFCIKPIYGTSLRLELESYRLHIRPQSGLIISQIFIAVQNRPMRDIFQLNQNIFLEYVSLKKTPVHVRAKP